MSLPGTNLYDYFVVQELIYMIILLLLSAQIDSDTCGHTAVLALPTQKLLYGRFLFLNTYINIYI